MAAYINSFSDESPAIYRSSSVDDALQEENEGSEEQRNFGGNSDAGEGEESNNSDEETDLAVDNDELLKTFRPKKAANKKGRKSSWPQEIVDDMVNIICSDDHLVKRLIFENTKNTRNAMLYAKIMKEIKKVCADRDQQYPYSLVQTRTKFKNCISMCKAAAMTIKTASGIKRFQDDKNLGNWFNQLFPLVKSRESAQPEQAIEPSSTDHQEVNSPAAQQSNADELSADTLSETSTESSVLSDGQPPTKRPRTSSMQQAKKDLFVPVKEKKTEKAGAMAEAVKCFNRLIENDPTKDLIQFLKEDNEKTRRHEMEMFKLQMQSQMEMQLQMIRHFSGYSQGMQGQFPQSNMPGTSYQNNANQGNNFVGLLDPSNERTYLNL